VSTRWRSCTLLRFLDDHGYLIYPRPRPGELDPPIPPHLFDVFTFNATWQGVKRDGSDISIHAALAFGPLLAAACHDDASRLTRACIAWASLTRVGNSLVTGVKGTDLLAVKRSVPLRWMRPAWAAKHKAHARKRFTDIIRHAFG
jgi:hypothetical protein